MLTKKTASKQSDTLVHVAFETHYFVFEAYGKNQAAALKALQKGLKAHAKQYGLEPDWAKVYLPTFTQRTIRIGTCLRDNEVIGE